MTQKANPHPLNVGGDYYVEDGCCTSCDVPRTEAPELFAMTDDGHCYVKRQPQSKHESDQMLTVIRCAELECIHYRGNDSAIISRLSAMGEMNVCDTNPPPGTELGIRMHVTFATQKADDFPVLASSFKEFLKTKRSKYCQITFPQFSIEPNTVEYKLNDTGWRCVYFDQHYGQVHVWHDDGEDTCASWHIGEWLGTRDGISDIRWFTDDGWHNTGVYHSSYY